MNIRKKLMLLTAFILLIVLLAAVFATAIYVNQSNKKGVVTTAKLETKFSSNILKQYPSTSQATERSGRTYSLNFFGKTENEELVTEIYVYNCVENSKKQFCYEDIAYDISFEVRGKNTNTVDPAWLPIINGTQMTGNSLIIENRVLRGRQLSTNSYEIEIPHAAVNNIVIAVTATPHAEYADLVNRSLLYRELAVVDTEIETNFEFTCTGEFSDSDSGKPSTEFRAFNYHISVANGSGKARLSWDTARLTIEESFYNSICGMENTLIHPPGYSINAGSSRYSIDFNVDSDLQESYDLVFYRTGLPIENESWANLAADGVVSFEVIP